MPNLYIIAGCNGAGKTTAAFTLLPEMLGVREFVNADEIARGLSPFQPDKVSIDAGKIMLRRIDDLLTTGRDFAFETTLSTRSFVILCDEAKQRGYTVYLIFYYLDSTALAIERVKQRVAEGGHDLPVDTIIRRYKAGLKNFCGLYKEIIDYWMLFDFSTTDQELIAEGKYGTPEIIYNKKSWSVIQSYQLYVIE